MIRFPRARQAFAAAVLLLLPALLLLLHYNKLALPTAQWDGTALDAVLALRSDSFYSDPYLIHPPLYLHLLAFFQPLFSGDWLAGARLFNFVCYVLTGWVVLLLSGSLTGEKEKTAAGLAGALLYLTSPLSVQGIFLLDLGDTSLVPLAAGLYFLHGSRPGPVGLAAAALLFAVNLWAKFIHSLFIALAAFAHLVFNRSESRRGLAVIAGTALFLLSWSVYAFANLEPGWRWTPIWYFFTEMIFNYQAKSLAAGPVDAVLSRLNSAVRILTWIWPLLLAWGARLYSRGAGEGRERYFNWFLFIFLAVSVLSKGTSNGFPKYHAVTLPLLCSLGGAHLAGALSGIRLAGLPAGLLATAAAVWAGLALAGDPLYTLNYSARAALISGSGLGPVLLKFLLQAAAAAASLLALFFVARRFAGKGQAAALAILAGALSWHTAVGFRQASADYFTTYGYGTRGKAEAVAWLALKKGGVVLGPNEFDRELKAAGVPFLRISDLCLANRACVLGILRDPGTGFFIFGQASNTVGQVKAFSAFTVHDLGRSFTSVKIGDFWIYSLGKVRP